MKRSPAQAHRQPLQLSREDPFTVSGVLDQVRACLKDNFLPLLVRGEVRDLGRPRSGHIYFSLRDERAQLKVVVFAGVAAKLPAEIREGEDVLVWGRIDAYPRRGTVQLQATYLEPAGLGALWAQREALRLRLLKEGLFAEERKRPLPYLPRSVGVVTSATGSALRDVKTTIARRFPKVRLVIAPTRVSGAGCAPEVARAITALDRRGRVDVLLVVRGGGSQEDLAGFDSELVVRAIAACQAPVVCGVGHETDMMLCDLVADKRAPTPTAAAELAVPVEAEVLQDLEDNARRLQEAMALRLERLRRGLARAEASHGMRLLPQRLKTLRSRQQEVKARLAGAHPRRRLAAWRLKLAEAGRRLARWPQDALQPQVKAIKSARARLRVQSPRPGLSERRDRLKDLELGLAQRIKANLHDAQLGLVAQAARLNSLSPLAVLSRGYSLTSDSQGRLLTDLQGLRPGDRIHTRLAEGSLESVVSALSPDPQVNGPQEVKP